MTDEVDALRVAVAELTEAVGAMGGLLAGALVGAGIADRDDLAERLDTMAREGGQRLAKYQGIPFEAARPNAHLQNLAAAVRKIGQPFQVVSGASNDDGPDAA